MKRTGSRAAVLAAVVFVVLVFSACAPDAVVRVKDSDNRSASYRLAEIAKNEDGTTEVYVRGTESSDACAYAFAGGGFGWQLYVGCKITCGGETLSPVKITPYLSSEEGNVMSFTFETDAQVDAVTLFCADNEQGGRMLDMSKLELDPAYFVSGSIATIE